MSKRRLNQSCTALFLFLLVGLSGDVALAADPPSAVELIVAAAHRRAERFRAVCVEWTVHELRNMDLSPITGVSRLADYPKGEIGMTNIHLLACRDDRWRFDRDGQGVLVAHKRNSDGTMQRESVAQVEDFTTHAFFRNGESRHFTTPPRDEPQGSGWMATKERKQPHFSELTQFPVCYLVRPTFNMIFRGLEAGDYFEVNDNEAEQNHQVCLQHSKNSTKLWFDPSHDFVPVRVKSGIAGGRISECHISYSENPICGYVPYRWNSESCIPDGRIWSTISSTNVVWILDNAQIDRELALDFPEGLPVQNVDTKKQFIAGPDGRLETAKPR
jgi:hypothetical protein